MPSPFEHTLRSIAADRSRGAVALLLTAALVLIGWGVWLWSSEVGVHEVTELARIESGSASHRVAAPVAGRVVATSMKVGDEVAEGDVLVELDRVQSELGLEEVRTRIASLDALVSLREREVESEREAVVALGRAAGAADSESRARLDRAVAAARLAEAEAVEAASLQTAQISSDAEARRTKSEAAQLEAATRELRSARSRQRWESAREVQDRLLSILRIEAELSRLEGERAAAQARVRQLEAEVERHTLRAPVAGVIGDTAPIETGSYVGVGETVTTIVPGGELRIVAQFDPASAVGRVAPDQQATLRLAGFPWTQYGVIRGRVTAVASEVRQGRIRVEVAIESVPPAIPIEHGLVGTLEVEVERTTPATLLLLLVT